MAAARDLIVMVVVLFMLAIGFFMSYGVMNDVYDTVLGIEAFNQSEAAVEAALGGKALTNRMDYVVFGVFIGLILSFLITGWFIAGNAVFSVIYFFVGVIAVVVSTILANAWETATQSAIFGADLLAFPITNNLILNLPIYSAVMVFLGMVVVFAKPSLGGGGGEFF